MSRAILPTHTCFDDALDFLQERLKANLADADKGKLWLVHAICIVPEGREAGQPFAHAWVEERVALPFRFCAWQGGLWEPGGERFFYAVPRQGLLDELKPTSIYRYTPREAWAENERTQTFGPWIEELKALCRKADELRRVFT